MPLAVYPQCRASTNAHRLANREIGDTLRCEYSWAQAGCCLKSFDDPVVGTFVVALALRLSSSLADCQGARR